MYADPTAFAALLELTGPVEADGQTLSADNAVQFLTKDQYAAADGAGSTGVGPLDPRRARALHRQRSCPARADLARAFGPAIAAGHLQFVTQRRPDDELLGDRASTSRSSPPTAATWWR